MQPFGKAVLVACLYLAFPFTPFRLLQCYQKEGPGRQTRVGLPEEIIYNRADELRKFSPASGNGCCERRCVNSSGNIPWQGNEQACDSALHSKMPPWF